MATRFYLRSTGAPAVSPSYGALWTDTSSATRLIMSPTKGATALASKTAAESSATSPFNLLVCQFVSDPMPAQAISGSFSASIKGKESGASADASLQVTLRAVDATTGAELAVLYAGHSAANNSTAGALGQEFPTATSASRLIPAGTALSSYTPAVQWRLVAEVGSRTASVDPTSFTTTIVVQDDQASDLPFTAADTSTANPWIELTQTFTFDVTAPSVPTSLTSPAKTSTTVDLSWTASTDAVGVTGYGVYKDGVKVGSDVVGTSTTVTGLSASTAYSFTVDAADAAGNRSAQTAGLPVTTSAAGGTPAAAGSPLTANLNRLAGTTGLSAQGAANAWAGTTGLALPGALNVKAGTSGQPLQKVLNTLAGTSGLAVDAAARAIP